MRPGLYQRLLEEYSRQFQISERLEQFKPKSFIMADPGSNVHVVFDNQDFTNITDSIWRISQFYTTSIGHLNINILGLDKNGDWWMCLIDSGAVDDGLTQLASKPLFSAQCVGAQGHASVEHGNSPGLYLHPSIVQKTTASFIPYGQPISKL